MLGSMDGKGKIEVGKLIGSAILVALLVYFFVNPELWHSIPAAGADPAAGSGGAVSSVSFLQIAVTLILTAAGLAALWLPCPFREKTKRILGPVGLLVTSVVAIFTLEYDNIYVHRLPWQVLRSIGAKKLFMTWIVVLLLAAWFVVLANRWQLASVLTIAVLCGFGVTCYFVYALRGVAFLASDLTTLQTAANVAGDYEYRVDYHTFTMVLFTVAWCDLINWTGSVKIFSAWRWRAAALACVIALTVLFDRVCFHTDMLRHRGVTVNTFRPEKSYGSNGALLTFVRSIRLMIVEEPEGYSVERVKEIEERYVGQETAPESVTVNDTEAESSRLNETKSTVAAQTKTGTAAAASAASAGTQPVSEDGKMHPNVIIVMDEAFCDLQASMNFETDQEVCPFFAGLKENTIRGRLYVSSFGGRTANTEYEVLTGDSMGFLPPSSTPYQLYIKDPMPNLNSALENRGWRHTVGMHPYLPSGYNRAKVYELFGFDRLLFLDEFAGAQTIAGKVTDEADIDRIIAEYEEAKQESDAPFVVQNVTMQNHAPYAGSAEDLGDPVHVVSGTGDYPDADVYLTLIRKSDQAFEKLVHYFEQTDDPTVVIFFGDHQPNLSDSFFEMACGKAMSQSDGEELMQFYHSDYVIWANYDIEEKEMDLSSNYLMPVMKQAAGMELTGYDRFLLELHEDLPIVSLNGYWDRDGVYYKKPDDPDSPWYDRLQDYGMLVYNHLFDTEHRTDEFFGGPVQ